MINDATFPDITQEKQLAFLSKALVLHRVPTHMLDVH